MKKIRYIIAAMLFFSSSLLVAVSGPETFLGRLLCFVPMSIAIPLLFSDSRNKKSYTTTFQKVYLVLLFIAMLLVGIIFESEKWPGLLMILIALVSAMVIGVSVERRKDEEKRNNS